MRISRYLKYLDTLHSGQENMWVVDFIFYQINIASYLLPYIPNLKEIALAIRIFFVFFFFLFFAPDNK